MFTEADVELVTKNSVKLFYDDLLVKIATHEQKVALIKLLLLYDYSSSPAAIVDKIRKSWRMRKTWMWNLTANGNHIDKQTPPKLSTLESVLSLISKRCQTELLTIKNYVGLH